MDIFRTVDKAEQFLMLLLNIADHLITLLQVLHGHLYDDGL